MITCRPSFSTSRAPATVSMSYGNQASCVTNYAAGKCIFSIPQAPISPISEFSGTCFRHQPCLCHRLEDFISSDEVHEFSFQRNSSFGGRLCIRVRRLRHVTVAQVSPPDPSWHDRQHRGAVAEGYLSMRGTDMRLCAPTLQRCTRCSETTLRSVDVQRDHIGRTWTVWRCDRCQFEKTDFLPLPGTRDRRTVIC